MTSSAIRLLKTGHDPRIGKNEATNRCELLRQRRGGARHFRTRIAAFYRARKKSGRSTCSAALRHVATAHGGLVRRPPRSLLRTQRRCRMPAAPKTSSFQYPPARGDHESRRSEHADDMWMGAHMVGTGHPEQPPTSTASCSATAAANARSGTKGFAAIKARAKLLILLGFEYWRMRSKAENRHPSSTLRKIPRPGRRLAGARDIRPT